MNRFGAATKSSLLAVFMALVPLSIHAQSDAGKSTSAGIEFKDAASAREWLTSKGLSLVGGRWLSADETQLRRLADSLDRLEKSDRLAQQQVDEALRNNQLIRAQIDQATSLQQRARDLAAATPKGGPQRKAADDEAKRQGELVKKLQGQWVEPKKLGETPAIQQPLSDLVAARNALSATLLSIQSLERSLKDAYDRLRADSSVAAALSASGSAQELGRAELSGRPSKTWSRLAEMVFTDAVPLSRESGRYRVGVVVNEQCPATFSFSLGDGPILIPTSLAQSAGLDAGRGQTVVFRAEGNRRLNVRVIHVPELRIGKCVLKDAEAYVLPPEAEDLGARLTSHALRGYSAQVDEQRMQLTLKPQD